MLLSPQRPIIVPVIFQYVPIWKLFFRRVQHVALEIMEIATGFTHETFFAKALWTVEPVSWQSRSAI